jgi:glycosyltransferase involved in cell wall biosynthesis
VENKISVIIPVYNAAETLKGCLSSIFASSYGNFEVVVVNDASTDNSAEIARNFPCKILNLTERMGPAFARDTGLTLAEGRIAAFLDSDCAAPTDWLAKINKRLSSGVDGVGGRYILPENIIFFYALFLIWWDPKNAVYKKLRPMVSLSGGNCAFWKWLLTKERDKRELLYCYRRVGGEDTIMCSELSRTGKLVFDPDIYVQHNKKCGFTGMLKESVFLGYSGFTVSAICGLNLAREPHRLYKAFIYLLSLSLFLALPFISLVPNPTAYFYLFIVYIAVQLPFVFLAARSLRRIKLSAILFPPVIFLTDICHALGQAWKICDILKGFVAWFAWHLKLAANIINPNGLLKVFFFVTKKCNADCYFCFNKQHKTDTSGDMRLDEIKDIASKIRFLPLLTITGGEPFLRSDISRICALFYKHCGTRIITIVTNGTYPSEIEAAVEKVLLECAQLNLSLIVALDDIGERHDRIKEIVGCYNQASLTLEKLSNLQKRLPRLKLGINTVVDENNAGRIKEILEYFRNNFHHSRQYLNLLRQPPFSGTEPAFISAGQYLGLLKSINSQEVASGRVKEYSVGPYWNIVAITP